MTSPLSPRLEKGRLTHFDTRWPLGLAVRFQYNPDTLDHRLAERRVRGVAGWRRVAPRETIRLTLTLDATDALERPEDHPSAASAGVLPQLSALELLLRPSGPNRSLWGLARRVGAGDEPYTVFQWGEARTVPVRLTALRVREQAFSPELRPLRATAAVELAVLTDADLPKAHPARRLWDAHLQRQRDLAEGRSP